jgi:hypothetical protein
VPGDETPRAAAARDGEIPDIPIPPVDAIPGQGSQHLPLYGQAKGPGRAELSVEESRPRQD